MAGWLTWLVVCLDECIKSIAARDTSVAKVYMILKLLLGCLLLLLLLPLLCLGRTHRCRHSHSHLIFILLLFF